MRDRVLPFLLCFILGGLIYSCSAKSEQLGAPYVVFFTEDVCFITDEDERICVTPTDIAFAFRMSHDPSQRTIAITPDNRVFSNGFEAAPAPAHGILAGTTN